MQCVFVFDAISNLEDLNRWKASTLEKWPVLGTRSEVKVTSLPTRNSCLLIIFTFHPTSVDASCSRPNLRLKDLNVNLPSTSPASLLQSVHGTSFAP